MRASPLWKISKYTLIIIATIVAAYYSAHLVRTYINRVQAARVASQRARFTEERLSQMGNALGVGTNLHDYQLWTLTGKSRHLADLAKDSALFIFIEPDCSSCESVISSVVASIDSQLIRRMFFLTSGNPFELRARNDLSDLLDHILYDHRASYRHYYDITDFPAFVVVDQNLTVLGITFGVLTSQEIKNTAKSLELPTYQGSE